MRKEPALDLGRATVALVPVTQADETDRLRDGREADDLEVAVDFGNLGKYGLHLSRIAVRVLDTGAFGRNAEADHQALVLLRRELGRQPEQQDDQRRHDQRGDAHHHEPQSQHPPQRAAITAGQAVQHSFAELERPVVLLLMLEQPRAHHRRQRQRGEARHEHRAGQGQRELDEQLAGAAGRKGHRHVDGRQRERHGHDREADFAAAFERRLERRHAFLDVSVDVFQHDDRVVDDEADGQHHGQQGQGVDREAEGVHQRKGADQRHRNRHQRNQRGPRAAQEQEDDDNDQQDRLADGLVDGLDGRRDEHRGVVGHFHFHAFRQCFGDLRQQLLEPCGDVQWIRRGLLDDAERHGGAAVVARAEPVVVGAELDARDVAETHQIAVGIPENDVFEFLRRAQIGLGQHGELALRTLDASGRHFDVLAAQGILHIARRELESGQTIRIEPHAHGVLAAVNLRLRDAADRLHAILYQPLGDVGDLEVAMAVAREGQIDDRLGVGFLFLHDRIVGLFRQEAARL